MWKQAISAALAGILLLSNLSFLYAQPEGFTEIPKDSSEIECRQPPDAKLNKYLGNEDFIYDRKPPPPETLWQKIKRWWRGLLEKAFDFEGSDTFFDVLIYIFIAAAATGAVLLLVRSNLSGLFSGKSRSVDQIGFREFDEDIDRVDFEKRIAECIERKDFRKAVRLYYLKILKELAGAGLIRWKPQKTNLDYQRELQDSRLQPPFSNVSFLFEYTWYGNFDISERMYEGISVKFGNFSNQITRPDV